MYDDFIVHTHLFVFFENMNGGDILGHWGVDGRITLK
jgi:hypothetical protein